MMRRWQTSYIVAKHYTISIALNNSRLLLCQPNIDRVTGKKKKKIAATTTNHPLSVSLKMCSMTHVREKVNFNEIIFLSLFFDRIHRMNGKNSLNLHVNSFAADSFFLLFILLFCCCCSHRLCIFVCCRCVHYSL